MTFVSTTAFSAASRARLRELFPDAIEVASTDAYVLGLNAVSDGRNVVLPASAIGFADQLHDAGFVPVGVDLSGCSRAAAPSSAARWRCISDDAGSDDCARDR